MKTVLGYLGLSAFALVMFVLLKAERRSYARAKARKEMEAYRWRDWRLEEMIRTKPTPPQGGTGLMRPGNLLPPKTYLN